MADFLMLMHNDATGGDWDAYIAKLQASGLFRGGSTVGGGIALKKAGSASITREISGYMRFEAAHIDDVKKLIDGNPVYENGGTVEIRELPRD